jgi:aminoglycoside phosphotransferase (APT) family kinase protein
MTTPGVPLGDELANRISRFVRAAEPDVDDVEVRLGHRTPLGQSTENLVCDAVLKRGGVAEEHRLIVRREGVATFTNGAVAEVSVLRALEATTVAAPAVRWFDQDGVAFGRPTILMERLDGVADADALTDHGAAGADPQARGDLARQMFDKLIDLHLVGAEALDLSGVPDRVEPDPARAEIDAWWSLCEASRLEPLPELVEVRLWLLEHLRPSGRTALIHGDFRPENVLFTGTRVSAVLDWELARVSDPLFDLGWYLLPIFLQQHTVPGTWEPSHIFEHYTERTGLAVDPDAVHAWSVLGMLQVLAMLLCRQRAFAEGHADEGWTWWHQQMLLHLTLTMIGV